MKCFQKTLFGLALALLLLVPSANAASDYAKTRYPIVLVHGFSGSKLMMGVVEYWYGIPAKLKQNGNNQVFVASVSSVAAEDIRVTQLEKLIADVFKKTGASKVNLIGHSQGGFTARAYAALHPEKVASITAVATPHHGTPICDLIKAIKEGLGPVLPAAQDTIVWAVEAFGWLNGALNGQNLEQDALGALELMSSRGAAEFARNVHGFGLSSSPNIKRDTYASGTIQNAAGQTIAWGYPMFSWTGSGAPPNLLRSGLNLLDPSDYLLDVVRLAMKNVLGGGENDGVVPVRSALFGEVICANYYWSHFDEVNQVMGLVPPGNDPRMAFVIHANRLKQAGL